MAGRQSGGRSGLRHRQVSSQLDWNTQVGGLSLLKSPTSCLLRTFPLALDMGGGKSHIAEHLSKVECERVDRWNGGERSPQTVTDSFSGRGGASVPDRRLRDQSGEFFSD